MKKATNLCILLIISFCNIVISQVNQVRVVEKNNSWQLLVNETPYYINGAGGDSHLDDLTDIGGNTIRTWGIENAQFILDEAEKRGIKVMLGLWVQHERHGFDYDDEAKVKNQLESFRSQIKKFKNHPALLIWCVGNEYELDYHNTNVWKAVNDIAKMIHEEDKNHPTATVTAGVSSEKLAYVMKELTDVDIYGINTYGDIGNVKSVLTKGNFKGPYMITEWGPNGHWESPKTLWGTSIEQTSKQKAESYTMRYDKFIKADSAQCLGSFAFLWGQKQEYTSTWYGIFNEDGFKTEVYDALAHSWSDKKLKNNSPSLDSISVKGNYNLRNLIVQSEQVVEVSVYTKDIDNDKLKIKWELYPESEDLKTGGDAESKPQEISGRLGNKKSSTCKLFAPPTEGRYRLYVTVSDGEKVAYANIPFYVEKVDNASFGKVVRLKVTDLKSFNND